MFHVMSSVHLSLVRSLQQLFDLNQIWEHGGPGHGSPGPLSLLVVTITTTSASSDSSVRS